MYWYGINSMFACMKCNLMVVNLSFFIANINVSSFCWEVMKNPTWFDQLPAAKTHTLILYVCKLVSHIPASLLMYYFRVCILSFFMLNYWHY